jgi:hypothetical protein
VNRKDRKAEKLLPKSKGERIVVHAFDNAYHWAEIRRIKQDYDRLSDAEKARRKPALAHEIDEHLAALFAE